MLRQLSRRTMVREQRLLLRREEFPGVNDDEQLSRQFPETGKQLRAHPRRPVLRALDESGRDADDLGDLVNQKPDDLLARANEQVAGLRARGAVG